MMEQIDAGGNATTLVHFVYQSEPERIACMPNMVEFHSTAYHKNYQRSNDPRAVSCPACRRTDAYKTARARYA